LLKSPRSNPLVFLFLHPPTFWLPDEWQLKFKLASFTYLLVTHLISLISYIITNLQDSHAHLPVIYLTFYTITCLLVPVHFEFSHHKYIIPFLFHIRQAQHLPLTNIILRLIIFSPLFLPPNAPLQCTQILL